MVDLFIKLDGTWGNLSTPTCLYRNGTILFGPKDSLNLLVIEEVLIEVAIFVESRTWLYLNLLNNNNIIIFMKSNIEII